MIALPVTCPTFIGRAAELDALIGARRDLAKSRGSFVAIGGEAGIGKSRLVRQFITRTGDRRVRNLVATECLEGGGEPLRPVRSIVEMLLEIETPAGLTPNAELALARMAPARASEAARAAAALPVDRAELFAGIVELVTAFAAKRSTIVIFEDIHWADPSTLDFLAYLAPRLARVRLLVIATHRVEAFQSNPALAGALARIEREPTVRRLLLEPFGRDELRALIVAALDGRAPVDETVIADVAMRSEGNAFFAEELLKEALSSARTDDRRLPISIRGIVVERIAGFDAFARSVLSYAAVLGLRFDVRQLAQIMECTLDQLIAPLRLACDAAVLVEDRDDPGWLHFRHALTRRVIYDELLAFDARRLHRRILETLERSGEDQLYALAEHAAAAGDVERTVRYGERAGEAAWALGGFAEAVVSFERAVAVCADESVRARLLERLAFPVAYGGNPRRAIALWEDVLAIRTRRAEYTDAARVLILSVCERFNLGLIADEGDAALAFVDAHAADIAPQQRDRLFILIACMRSELAHMQTIDGILARIAPHADLPAEVEQSVLITRINRAAYFGRVATWRTELATLNALTPIHENASVDALNVCDHLASVIASGVHLAVHADIEAALSRGRALADTWKFERFARHYDALEAAYLFTRGQLDEARERFVRAGGDAMHLTAALLARTAPLLAVALDAGELLECAITPDVLEEQRAALRANADSDYSRLVLGGYAVWLMKRARETEALRFLDEAFAGITHPSPRFASLVAFALRHFAAERIPNLAAFADTSRLSPDDRTGHATAVLATAALDADAAGFGRAAAAFRAAGFPLCAAHAAYCGGDAAVARELYLSCGAIGYARDDRVVLAEPAVRRAALSEREYAVAQRVARGLTNSAIAEEMALSKKSIEKYLASIFRKLGLRSRSQVGAVIAEPRA